MLKAQLGIVNPESSVTNVGWASRSRVERLRLSTRRRHKATKQRPAKSKPGARRIVFWYPHRPEARQVNGRCRDRSRPNDLVQTSRVLLFLRSQLCGQVGAADPTALSRVADQHALHLFAVARVLSVPSIQTGAQGSDVCSLFACGGCCGGHTRQQIRILWSSVWTSSRLRRVRTLRWLGVLRGRGVLAAVGRNAPARFKVVERYDRISV